MKNKKRMILTALCIVTALLCSYLGTLTVSAANESVYLSDYLIQNPDKMTEYSGWLILKDSNGKAIPGLNKLCNGKPLKMLSKYYEKGIGTHSSEEGPSQLVINIEGLGYEYFTALVGMADEEFMQEVERNVAGFIVKVDGKEVKSTDPLTYTSQPVEISVPIKDAKTLTLALNPNLTNYSDLAVWANAKLSNDSKVDQTSSDEPIVPTLPPMDTQKVYLSDYLRNDLSKMKQYTGYTQITVDEEPVPGFDTAYDGTAITIYNKTYDKGIGMHVNETEGEETILEINIKGKDFVKFTATIGMNDYEWPQDVERNVAKFIVEVDGKIVYTSEVMKYDSKPQDISIDITNASTLSLRLDPNETTYSDSALWANAMLVRSDSYVAPTPTPTATQKTGVTATPGIATAKSSSTPAPVESTGLSTTWIIVIIVATVVVVGGIVTFAVISKKKRK